MRKASSLHMPVNAGFAGLFALSLLIAAAPGPAKADTASLDREFCAAIGLQPDAQAGCVADLAAATTDAQRRDAHDKWVANSAVASRDSTSLYQPAVDQNVKNGTPGSPYESKLLHVSNQTTAEIYRALRDDNMGPATR